MVSRRTLRLSFAAVLLASAVGLVAGYAPGATGGTFDSHLTAQGVADPSAQIAPPRDDITVVATDSNSWLGRESGGARARAELVAFAPNGSVLYYNDSHTRYWDVDPVPGTRATVEYAYADHLNASECPSDWNLADRKVDAETWERYESNRVSGDRPACTQNGYERVNLTTGEVTAVWSQSTPGKEATRYHDVDRVNGTHLAVADIFLDRVFVVNAETGKTTWAWNATDAFDPANSGGPHPADWTHINDVELLDDGRVMVSMRNHDRVVFLKPGSGVQENWTLGAEDDHRVLYEQHNPDYIPEANGGPAVVVADSENNRVVEYQREGGEWNRTWRWRDADTQWPRDADRLPNGHTLITDSNGNRVFEVNERGEKVWSVPIAFPYEAERLGTGDESAGGPSAAKAGLQSHHGSAVWLAVKDLLPGKYLNGVMYVTPTWMGLPELTAAVVLPLTLLAWGTVELGWRLDGGIRGAVGRRLRGLSRS